VNGEMNLNVLGQKMNDTIAEIPTHHPYAKIPVYQVMPNHVHLIVCIDETKMKRNDGSFAALPALQNI
jgi:REP element-mobilizing transposase RayT